MMLSHWKQLFGGDVFYTIIQRFQGLRSPQVHVFNCCHDLMTFISQSHKNLTEFYLEISRYFENNTIWIKVAYKFMSIEQPWCT